MVNKGKRIGDAKKKKQVNMITFNHNPNDAMALPDPIQQFDILTGVEKEKKVRPKEVFEDYHDKPFKREVDKSNIKHRNVKMTEAQVRGKKRGLDKKKVPKPGVAGVKPRR